MAKQTQSEQLDRIVEALLGRADAPLARTNATLPFNKKLSPVIEVIRDLRDLPRANFKASLKADLERRAAMASTGVKAIPEGLRTITPYLVLRGAGDWIEFAKYAFGAQERFRVKGPDGERIMHSEVQIGDSVIQAGDAGADHPPMPGTIWLRVRDVDSAYNRALERGAISTQVPVDQDYGGRIGAVEDPWGNNWYIFCPTPGSEIFDKLYTVNSYMHPPKAQEYIDFMQRAFGAEEVYKAQSPEGMVLHAQIRVGNSFIGMGDARGPFHPRPATFHLYVTDTDSAYERALRAGATSIHPPADQPYGDRRAGVIDPLGNHWYIATHIKDMPL